MTSKPSASTRTTTNSNMPTSLPTPPLPKTDSSTSSKSQPGESQPQDKSPSILPPVKPVVVEKIQEPVTPVVIKMPHQNPEPSKKPEEVQRRNVPRFVRY